MLNKTSPEFQAEEVSNIPHLIYLNSEIERMCAAAFGKPENKNIIIRHFSLATSAIASMTLGSFNTCYGETLQTIQKLQIQLLILLGLVPQQI